MITGPIKKRNIPEVLIYKSIRADANGTPYRHYTAFNQNGKIIGLIDGEMQTINPLIGSPFFPDLKSFKSFYVYYLESHQHNFGSKLLDFVQNVSRKKCKEYRGKRLKKASCPCTHLHCTGVVSHLNPKQKDE